MISERWQAEHLSATIGVCHHHPYERILSLSAFGGDSRAALRALHAHFAADFPGCSLALLLVRGQASGRCRLAGLIGPDATEHVPNLDANGEHSELPAFDDALALSPPCRHIRKTPSAATIRP